VGAFVKDVYASWTDKKENAKTAVTSRGFCNKKRGERKK
jgi:hypothetical protein